MTIDKKFKKAAAYQLENNCSAGDCKKTVAVKSKCCKSYKKKKGQMCKRCPKLVKILAKKGQLAA